MARKQVEGLWDCPYCGEIGIRGLIRECPNCGKVRGEETKFYLPGNRPARELTHEEAKKVGKNPDWYCSHCDSLNPDAETHCLSCGAPRYVDSKDYFDFKQNQANRKKPKREFEVVDEYGTVKPVEEKPVITPVSESRQEPQSSRESRQYNFDNTHSYQENRGAERYQEPWETNTKKQSSANGFFNGIWNFFSNNWRGIAGVMAAVLVIALIVSMFVPTVKHGTIEDFRWNRTFEVEEYKTVQENGWSVPAGGRTLYTQREIRSYEQVLDHYETKTRTWTERELSHYDTRTYTEDNGNGTFDVVTEQVPVYKNVTKSETYQEPVYRSEPVYDTKYYYEIERWVTKTYIETDAEDHNPVWGEYTYAENERRGSQSENYYITVLLEDESKEYSISYDSWNKLNVGDEVDLEVYWWGGAELIEETVPIQK